MGTVLLGGSLTPSGFIQFLNALPDNVIFANYNEYEYPEDSDNWYWGYRSWDGLNTWLYQASLNTGASNVNIGMTDALDDKPNWVNDQFVNLHGKSYITYSNTWNTQQLPFGKLLSYVLTEADELMFNYQEYFTPSYGKPNEGADGDSYRWIWIFKDATQDPVEYYTFSIIRTQSGAGYYNFTFVFDGMNVASVTTDLSLPEFTINKNLANDALIDALDYLFSIDIDDETYPIAQVMNMIRDNLDNVAGDKGIATILEEKSMDMDLSTIELQLDDIIAALNQLFRLEFIQGNISNIDINSNQLLNIKTALDGINIDTDQLLNIVSAINGLNIDVDLATLESNINSMNMSLTGGLNSINSSLDFPGIVTGITNLFPIVGSVAEIVLKLIELITNISNIVTAITNIFTKLSELVTTVINILATFNIISDTIIAIKTFIQSILTTLNNISSFIELIKTILEGIRTGVGDIDTNFDDLEQKFDECFKNNYDGEVWNIGKVIVGLLNDLHIFPH